MTETVTGALESPTEGDLERARRRALLLGAGRHDEPLETSAKLIDLIEDYIAQPTRGLFDRLDPAVLAPLESVFQE